MPLINVVERTPARAVHVQQIINLLRGVPANSEAVSLTGTSNASVYALTVANRDATNGRGFRVQNSTQTIDLLSVANAGVVVRPHASSQDVFTVRNFADNADLFKVSTSGVSLGPLGNVVTETATQNVSNKTISNSVFSTGNRMSGYLDVFQTSAPTDPAASHLRVYAVSGSDFLRYRTSAGVESTIVDHITTQTLFNKTLSVPNIYRPFMTDYTDIANISTPVTPSVGRIRVYSTSDIPRYMNSSGQVGTFVTQDASEELTNKTITNPIITNPTISTPTIQAYAAVQHTTTPGGTPSGVVFFYAKNNNVLYSKGSDAIERQIVDTESSQTISNKTFGIISLTTPTLSAPIISNYAELTQQASLGTNPSAGITRVWAKNDNNIYYRVGSVDQLILTSTNTSIPASSSFARPMMFGAHV